jgi:hypothetical protein
VSAMITVYLALWSGRAWLVIGIYAALVFAYRIISWYYVARCDLTVTEEGLTYCDRLGQTFALTWPEITQLRLTTDIWSNRSLLVTTDCKEEPCASYTNVASECCPPIDDLIELLLD